MVARTVAKMYQRNLKANVYNQLADIGFFYNKFTEVTLKTDVLPWLFEETEAYLLELNAMEEFPNTVINNFISDISHEHKKTITAHNEKRDN